METGRIFSLERTRGVLKRESAEAGNSKKEICVITKDVEAQFRNL